MLASLVLASAAQAQDLVCVVSDPNDPTLNLPATPNGRVVGRVRNFDAYTGVEVTYDAQGRDWVLLRHPHSGARMGWAFGPHLRCRPR